MDAQQIGESIAKAVSREHKGVDVDFGEVIGRREDGSVSVSVGGGVVAARAMASFDVGAAIGKQVMLVEKGGVVTIMGTMADVDNSHAFGDAVDKINAANAAIDGIQADIDSVESQVSGVRADAEAAQSAADAASQAADEAAQSARDASQKADQLAGKVDDVEVAVSGFDGRLDELSTSVSGAVSDAGEALSTATEAKQTADSVSTTAQQAYENAEEALTQASSAVQTASQVQTTVSRDYLSKADASKTYATQSQLTQTADSITSTVADTYQPKGDYATSEDVSDAVAQEVIDRNSAISQSAASITSQVSQTYLKKSDAEAGYQPKGDYATGAELDEAIADEVASRNSAIEQSASSILSTVSQNYVNNVTGAAYATKTEVEQTADGITQTVAETYLSKKDAGATYASKTELTQTSDGLKVSITEAATAAGDAQTAADSAQNIAEGAASAAETAMSVANAAQTNVNTVNTYFEFDAAGLHVGKRATSAAGAEYQTAECVVGADGSFSIMDTEGNEVAKFDADSIQLMAGILALSYQSSGVQLLANSASANMMLATMGAGPVNIYTNASDRTHASALYLADLYAMLATCDGTSDSLGSGAYLQVGRDTSNGLDAVVMSADRLTVKPTGGSASYADMKQVASRLTGDASQQYLTGGVTLMTHPCGAVCLAVNAVAFPALAQWGTHSMGTVPAAYRPKVQVGCMGSFATSDSQVLGSVVVGTSGAVTFTAYNACSAGQATCNLSWCV